MTCEQMLRRISQIVEQLRTEFTIVIDAIDEHKDIEGFVNELGELVKYASDLHVRFVLGVNLSEWGRVIFTRGVKNDLALEVFDTLPLDSLGQMRLPSSPDGQPERVPGTLIPLFDEAESQSAWQRYRSVYAISGELGEDVGVQLRLPYYMRLFSETFRGQQQLPSSWSPASLHNRWLHQRLDRAGSPVISQHVVGFLAGAMVQRTQTIISEEMAIETLRQKAVADPEGVVRELVRCGVMRRRPIESQIRGLPDEAGLEFPHSRILHFVYAAVEARWPHLSVDELCRALEAADRADGVAKLAAQFYLLEIDRGEGRVGTELLRTRPVTYVSLVGDGRSSLPSSESLDALLSNFRDAHQVLRDDVFPGAALALAPWTGARSPVGLLVRLNSESHDELIWSLRSIGNQTGAEITIEDNAPAIHANQRPSSIQHWFQDYGVRTIHLASENWLREKLPQHRALAHTLDKLQGVLKRSKDECLLDESACSALGRDRVAAWLRSVAEFLDWRDVRDPLRDEAVVESLECRELLDRMKLWRYSQGIVWEIFAQESVHGMLNLTPERKDQIAAEARRRLSSGVEPPSDQRLGTPATLLQFERLVQDLSVLRSTLGPHPLLSPRLKAGETIYQELTVDTD